MVELCARQPEVSSRSWQLLYAPGRTTTSRRGSSCRAASIPTGCGGKDPRRPSGAGQLRPLRQRQSNYWKHGECRVPSPNDYPGQAQGREPPLISETALQKIDSFRGNTPPNDLNATVTRNYGETSKDKSDELLKHLFLATLSVTLLIALALGWRESGLAEFHR